MLEPNGGLTFTVVPSTQLAFRDGGLLIIRG
jgi:hypothetical protein